MAATTASLGVAMSDVVVDSLVVVTAPPRTQAGAVALLTPWRSHLSPTSPHISATGSSLSTVLNPTHCIEVLLRGGRRLTFGNLLDREGTIRLLRAARTQAQHQHTPGP